MRGRTTYLSFESPSTKPTTHGSTLISSLVTRKGTLATFARRNSVSKCFAASFCRGERVQRSALSRFESLRKDHSPPYACP